MGASYSNAVGHLRREVCAQLAHEGHGPTEESIDSAAEGTVLPYMSLLQLRLMDGMAVDVGHLAVLFVLDSNRDGLVSWADIRSFVDWVDNNVPQEKNHGDEFSDAVHARCVLHMWRECGDGDVFEEWFERFLFSNFAPPDTEIAVPTSSSAAAENGDATSLSLDAVAAAHALLGVQESYGYDLRTFCAMLVGEGCLRRQMRHDIPFYCPAQQFRAFSSAFIESYFSALRRFGLQPLL